MRAVTNFDRLSHGAETIVPTKDLKEKLSEGRPLRVKLGLDPTASAVTLGWGVVLQKLRDFQDAGHTAVLIVGDFTARVGDPSGRNQTRPRLDPEVIDAHAQRLLTQFGKVLSAENLEIRHNSEWLAELSMDQILGLTAEVTIAQMLERSDFSNRMEANQPISMLEFMYPLLQAYDSVAVEADIELGGADQLWNLMMGRTIQAKMGQSPQVALTTPLLVGTDGEQKMSQSLNNYIGIEDPPAEMFGKVMSIPDSLMVDWFRLLTPLTDEEIGELGAALESETLHRGETKRRLARAIVSRWWDEPAAIQAEDDFNRQFRDGQSPREIPSVPLPPENPVYIPRFLTEQGLTSSNSEARRLLSQGAIKIDGTPLKADEIPANELSGRIIQVGKRRFLRVN